MVVMAVMMYGGVCLSGLVRSGGGVEIRRRLGAVEIVLSFGAEAYLIGRAIGFLSALRARRARARTVRGSNCRSGFDLLGLLCLLGLLGFEKTK